MTTQALSVESEGRGVRPLRLPQDLLQLADLLEVAFGGELVKSDSHLVQDMRQAARLGALLWMTGGSRLNGFVYTDGAQVVGNISLSQDLRDSASWFISNVAVLPEYRGQGIASLLLDHALAHIRTQHGRWVRLQVRSDHPVAYGLYQRRGFITYDTTQELKLDSRLLNPDLAGADRRLRPLRPRDSRPLWYLAADTTAPILLRQRAVRPADYRRTWWAMLDNYLESWFAGSARYEIAGYAGRTLAAYGALQTESESSPIFCELRVLPRERGKWEEALIRQLVLHTLGQPHRNLHASISLGHPEALDALQRQGFSLQRSLAQMSLELDNPI